MASTKLVAVVRGKIFESSSSILTSGSDSEVNSLEGGGGDIRLVIKKLQEIGVYVQVSGLSSCLGIYIIFWWWCSGSWCSVVGVWKMLVSCWSTWRSVTIRTIPNASGWTFCTRAYSYCVGAALSFLINTSWPTPMLALTERHFTRGCKLVRYSFFQHDHIGPVLQFLPMIQTISRDVLNIRFWNQVKWMSDQKLTGVNASGLLDRRHSGRLLGYKLTYYCC